MTEEKNWHIITLFPEFFASALECGLLKKALDSGILTVNLVNPRDFSTDPHRHVDDRPYGGGAGMVMQAEPLAAAVRSLKNPGRLVLLAPRGRPFNQAIARELAQENNVTLICGRYEGIDERLCEIFPIDQLSIGPFVLNGGESAALAMLEAAGRLMPGFMGKEESALEESFSGGLLEYPQYTRPEEFEGHRVPDVLLSGDHGRIAAWRRENALATTLETCPEMLDEAPLAASDVAFLQGLPRKRAAANFSFCLLHHPVHLEQGKTGTASLTNLDIHDIARISCSYGMGPFYVATPLRDQFCLLEGILRHWTSGPGGMANSHRKKALELVRPVESLLAAQDDLARRAGRRPYLAASSAIWPGKRYKIKLISARDARRIAGGHPFLLCLGTARGLANEVLAQCDGMLRPIRFLSENHLSVRAAAAILADRIFGDYC